MSLVQQSDAEIIEAHNAVIRVQCRRCHGAELVEAQHPRAIRLGST
jgi:hypothetical protein